MVERRRFVRDLAQMGPERRALRLLSTPVENRKEALFACESAIWSAMVAAAQAALGMVIREIACEECDRRVRALIQPPHQTYGTGKRNGQHSKPKAQEALREEGEEDCLVDSEDTNHQDVLEGDQGG